MDDFPGLLARDFGFRPQGKAAPMSSSRGPTNAGAGSGSGVSARTGGWNSTPSDGSDSLFGNQDVLFGTKNQRTSQDYGGFDDIFGGLPRGAPPSSSSPPVYDKPVYDDDIFDGVPGIKSSGAVKYNDVFSSMSTGPSRADQYDDLLAGFGRSEADSRGSSGKQSADRENEASEFDDLIPGFGGSSPPQKRENSETNRAHPSTFPSAKSASSVPEDPFVVLEPTSVPVYSPSGLFADPLEHINRPSNTNSTKVEGSSAGGTVFDDIDAFEGLTLNGSRKDASHLKAGPNMSPSHSTASKEVEKTSVKTFENIAQKKAPVDDRDSHPNLFDMPTGFTDSHGSVGRSVSRSKDVSANSNATSPHVDMSPKSEENAETADDVWLTVDEIPLFTQPTSAPPPSRPPPPFVAKAAQTSKPDRGSTVGINMKTKVAGTESAKSSGISSIDELEDFAMGRPQNNVNERSDVASSEEEIEPNSAAAASAAAMKEAMDRAEAKFKHAREVRERERDAKSVRSREFAQQEGDDKLMQDAQEREFKEKQERLDREREQREMEEKEREKKRLERERERERIEREKARHAVERATREARERAAAEARTRAERAAVEKANAEARERAERAAVQRAAAEARERAASEARERAEKAALEARERAAAEARQRAAAEARDKAATEARERAAVERAAAEVRARAERAAVERANTEARERAAAVAREKQQRNENDLDSFFGMGARPSSAPRQRSATPDSAFDAQFQSGGYDTARRTPSAASSSIRKASSATNIVDDLTSIFGATPSAGDFQEVEGESEERRRARLDRHQRTRERAAKALAEKNERDMQTLRDQAERHRIAETLDVEIKRWAAGKEGNLRALLSTLQYVLWPECGWQPVSLTDLITGASVKKVYRKATLCIHPDKVQQKGANLQQKYVAEKVFDLLKEAWNKFNSEELF